MNISENLRMRRRGFGHAFSCAKSSFRGMNPNSRWESFSFSVDTIGKDHPIVIRGGEILEDRLSDLCDGLSVISSEYLYHRFTVHLRTIFCAPDSISRSLQRRHRQRSLQRRPPVCCDPPHSDRPKTAHMNSLPLYRHMYSREGSFRHRYR